jgi:glycosyltransferase involved in cell wall biosynthesis
MHVVQALVSLSLGGSELVAIETTEYLRTAGHRVTVIAANGPLESRVGDAGAELLDWSIGRKRLATLGYIKKLRAWLLENQPDIVHVHSRLPAWICHLAIKKLPADKRPVFITSMHGHYSVSSYSAIMARGDRVIAVSKHIRDYTLKYYLPADNGKLRTIYGGTSRDVFRFDYHPPRAWLQQTHDEYPELENKRILLLPGRLSRYKGHATFIELLASLQSEFTDIHGVILGRARRGSRYINELEGLADRHGIRSHLTFCGARTDVQDWMAASNLVFNLCSDPPEAFGRTVPEALALGVPVIAWGHGGVQEILEPMFPEGSVLPDSPSALLEKTRAFLHHAPGVQPSGAFSLRESMEHTMALYREALTGSEEAT